MNKGTSTVALCVHFPTFCEIKDWICSFCWSQRRFLIGLVWGKVFRLLKRVKTNFVPFATELVVQSTISIPYFLPPETPISTSKLRTSLCHICPVIMVQNYISIKYFVCVPYINTTLTWVHRLLQLNTNSWTQLLCSQHKLHLYI